MSGPAADNVKFYPQKEERLNIATHAIGFILACLGLILLLEKTLPSSDYILVFSISLFGICLCLLFAASTLYHRSVEPRLRSRWRTMDHAAIYLLIAGSYTPFTLITLKGNTGLLICSIVWFLAFIGILLKTRFTGRFKFLSTVSYMLMGWQIIFVIRPLLDNLPDGGVFWLFAGGLAYTLGSVLYLMKKLPYHHAIFHVFVLAGSACHYMAVYYFVIP